MSPAITPVELRAVAQRFGRKVVLRAVDLELPAATITGLVGENIGLLAAALSKQEAVPFPLDVVSIERTPRSPATTEALVLSPATWSGLALGLALPEAR